ncbi:MAG TPA: Gfo/Idh/MocA family oxidoreductase [Armatimonadota bacterium]|nr:Gfo/Idh/MocA family oxidoreductase [Armatimonadota bacterium]
MTADRRRGLSRREFVRRSVVLGGTVVLPYVVPGRALGKDGAVAPSERVVVGAIGIGPRGKTVLDSFFAQPDVQFVAICDVRADRREAVKAAADAHHGSNDCVMYRDLRDLLARDDIDAVLIATGDRWHSLGTILAVKSGKDVYSEKPCALTIGLCQSMADAVHRYGRVFQAGTQRRSIGNFQAAVRLAHSGKLGRLRTLHASSYRPRVTHEWLPEEEIPPREVIDWDLWLGPAPWRPYNSAYVNGGWRGHFDFDSGCRLLDWGAHTVDLCQWANQSDDTLPTDYEASEDKITARYANGVELVIDFLETPFGNRDPLYGTSRGTCPVRYEGDEGWVETGDSGEIAVYPESLRAELDVPPPVAGTDSMSHVRNFIDCVKSGARPNANVDVMRRSHIACHAAALSWQLGRKLSIDPATEMFINDDEANRLRFRAMREPWRV